MLAEHVSSASIEALQRKLIGGRWENDDGIDGVPDVVRQGVEDKRIVPLTCEEFQIKWKAYAERRYVKNLPLTFPDLVFSIHEGSCHNRFCQMYSSGSDELFKATPKDPKKNARYIQTLDKKVKTERAKLNKSPIVVNPVPFR